jgi:hypothetical protein
MPKIPRKGTRVRAVFDELYNDYHWIGWTEPRSDCPGNTTWGEAKAAYDDHDPAYPRTRWGPRRHSDMNVSRILRKYANRISRGMYQLKPEYASQQEELPLIELTDADIIVDEVEEAVQYIDQLPPADLMEAHRELGEVNNLLGRAFDHQRDLFDMVRDTIRHIDELNELKGNIVKRIEKITGRPMA